MERHTDAHRGKPSGSESSFLMDWYFITRKNLRRRKPYSYRLPDIEQDAVAETCYMQIVSSGPDSDWADIMQLYLTSITEARTRITITTPYFIPNESILNALKIAALGRLGSVSCFPRKRTVVLYIMPAFPMSTNCWMPG